MLLQKGCKSVIVTLGAEGAVYVADGVFEHVTAEKVVPVDTTVGGLMSIWLNPNKNES